MNGEWAEFVYGEGKSSFVKKRTGKEGGRAEKVVDSVTFCCGTGESQMKASERPEMPSPYLLHDQKTTTSDSETGDPLICWRL